jgi:hypothetical protein
MPIHYANCRSLTIPKLQPLSSHASDHGLALQPWYKFMSAKYAKELCEHGRILLSNLFYYRRDENLAAGLLDLQDGQYFKSKSSALVCAICGNNFLLQPAKGRTTNQTNYTNRAPAKPPSP